MALVGINLLHRGEKLAVTLRHCLLILYRLTGVNLISQMAQAITGGAPLAPASEWLAAGQKPVALLLPILLHVIF